MLMSYALDAGRAASRHGRARQAASRPQAASPTRTWPARARPHVGFDRVEIDKATEYAAEDADVTLRLWRVLKPRLTAERMTTVYETLERPLVPVLARMERARHLDRPGDPVAAFGRVRADRSRGSKTRSMSLRARASIRAAPSSSAISCSARWAAGRHQDADRRLVHARQRARGPGRGRPRAAEENSRVAPAHEAEIHLHGRAARTSSTPRPSAYTRLTRSRRRRPAASPPPIRTCRTSRSARRKAARSAAPSSPRRA